MSGLTYLGDTIQEFSKSDIVDDNTKCILTTNSTSTDNDRNVSAIKLSNFRKWISESLTVNSDITVNTKCCITMISATSNFTLNISEPYQQVTIINDNPQTQDKQITVTITGSKGITVAPGSTSCVLYPLDSCIVFASDYTVTYSEETVRDKVYPVGTYYYSDNNINPNRYFGGSWVQISGRFIINEGTFKDGNNVSVTYAINQTGGESTHTLSVAEMPWHTHTFPNHIHYWTQFNDNGAARGGTDRKNTANRRYMYRWQGQGPYQVDYSQFGVATSGPNCNSSSAYANASNLPVFGSGAHNNMPRYMQSFCWRRDG